MRPLDTTTLAYHNSRAVPEDKGRILTQNLFLADLSREFSLADHVVKIFGRYMTYFNLHT